MPKTFVYLFFTFLTCTRKLKTLFSFIMYFKLIVKEKVQGCHVNHLKYNFIINVV